MHTGGLPCHRSNLTCPYTYDEYPKQEQQRFQVEAFHTPDDHINLEHAFENLHGGGRVAELLGAEISHMRRTLKDINIRKHIADGGDCYCVCIAKTRHMKCLNFLFLLLYLRSANIMHMLRVSAPCMRTPDASSVQDSRERLKALPRFIPCSATLSLTPTTDASSRNKRILGFHFPNNQTNLEYLFESFQ